MRDVCRWCYNTGLKRYADKPGLYYCHCAVGRRLEAEESKMEDPVEESPVQGFPV